VAVRIALGEAGESLDGSATSGGAARYKLKNPAAVALGKLGGQRGGKARAAKLNADERSAIARRAATARWKNDG
jgi:hypothetical protein